MGRGGKGARCRCHTSHARAGGARLLRVPHTGINFDDGLGGGSRVSRNVLFNWCRESSDHGPFNSWDRQPYLVDSSSGPTVFKQNDTITLNFVLANYHSSMAIDNVSALGGKRRV